MRTFFIFILIILILAGFYLLYAQISGGAVPTFGLPIGGERAEVRHRIKYFFEQVKFKNTNGLISTVSEGSSTEDLEKFLNQTFGVSPAEADLQRVEVESVEIDSSGTRARAMVRLHGQNLALSKPFQATRLIFLYKNTQNHWLLDIKHMAL